MDADHLTQARLDIVELRATVSGMGREIGELKDAIKQLTSSVATLTEQLAAAKGGGRMLMLLGGASATLGGVIAWVAQHLLGRQP